jgi:hypothetical protein
VFGIFCSRSAKPVGLAEQHLAVLRHQHRAAEPVRRGLLANEGLERRQGLRLGQPVEDEIEGTRRFRGIEELDPGISARPDGLEADVVHAGAQRSLVVALRETETHRLARPRREIHAHRSRLEAGRIGRRGAEDVHQHVAVGHGVDRSRGIDEVDPELLVRLGRLVCQCVWRTEGGAPFVENGQVQGRSTVQADVPVEDAGAGAVHVGHSGERMRAQVRSMDARCLAPCRAVAASAGRG